MTPSREKILKSFKWLLEIVAIFFITLGVIYVVAFSFSVYYKYRLLPGIYLGRQYVGGLPFEQVENIINERIDDYDAEGFTFRFKDQKVVVYPINRAQDSDIAINVVYFDRDKTLKSAEQTGRSSNVFVTLINGLSLLIKPVNIRLESDLNADELIKTLKPNFKQFEVEPINARLSLQKTSNYQNDYAISPETNGFTIDYSSAQDSLKTKIANFEQIDIELSASDNLALVKKADALNIGTKISRILSLAPISINAHLVGTSTPETAKKIAAKKWVITESLMSSWLVLKPSGNSDDKIKVGLDQDKINAWLSEKISPGLAVIPKNAKFTIKDGKVTSFEKNQNGLEILLDESAKNIASDIDNATSTSKILVREVPSLATDKNINDLGITEIIGTGHSNFAGSPKNRRTNIRVGVGKLTGLLIAPGEEFSTIKSIGKIDASTGFLEELVIKGNKTTPEYGGGLCQVGTTMFRTVIKSGLPVTMRRNHSYRVGYYEPAGTDATIYDPAPDFRFINDTGNYILIQSRIEGNDLYFDFWGTRDGREASSTYPKIYNIKKPAPAKIIETLDLKPGEKKCSEKAHNGADAWFDYFVQYPSGERKEKRFTSHYVPWQEVCLLGVEKLTTASSTTPSSITTETKPAN